MESKPPSASCNNDLLDGYRSLKETSSVNEKVKEVVLDKIPKEGVVFGHLVQSVPNNFSPIKYKIKKKKKKEEKEEE